MQADQFQVLQRAARSPWYFMQNFVQTLDPRRGVLGFPDYEFVRELIETAQRERFLLVPKSRQMMVTWSMVAFFLWKMLFRGPGIYLFLSRNERCAEELIGRVKFIYDHLPDFFRPPLTANSRQEIAFGGLGSRIFSIPATPDGPRMYSPSAVFWDEMAFTPYDRQIWAALQPGLMSGGSFVGVSSSGGACNFFAEIAIPGASELPHISRDLPVAEMVDGCGANARDREIAAGSMASRESLFHIHRIHYTMHPDRETEQWKREAGAGLSNSQWQREQEISFEAEDDLVYAEFESNLHLLSEEWQVHEDWEIYRTIDFGYRKPFVLWLQHTPSDEYVVFDEWSGSNATTSDMLEAIRRIDAVHGIREHDVRWTACDPAGAAMQDSGLSPVDLLKNDGIKLCYRSSRILPGIEQVKAALRDVRGRVALRISPRCRKFIRDIASYRWAPGREEPLKDGESDHSLDALRYFFVNLNSQEPEFIIAPRISASIRL